MKNSWIHVVMANSQNPLQLLRAPPAEQCRGKGIRKHVSGVKARVKSLCIRIKNSVDFVPYVFT